MTTPPPVTEEEIDEALHILDGMASPLEHPRVEPADFFARDLARIIRQLRNSLDEYIRGDVVSIALLTKFNLVRKTEKPIGE